MLMPMTYYATSTLGPAQITMGTYTSLPYFISAQAASDFGVPQTGSATGDRSADGGTIEVLGQGNSTNVAFYILGGNATSSLTVNINGTNYTASYQGPAGLNDAYKFYAFSGSIFTSGNTYTVIVT